jgi:ferritin-like metal-binding protein YciE
MNETTDPSLRFDSADAAQANGNERHTILTYLSDVIALERHIAQPLKGQLDMDDAQKFGDAAGIISTIKSYTDTHVAALEAQLKVAGGDAAAPVKSAISQLLGAGAAAVNTVRKSKVSKSLRDDYTALALATVSYTMLHTTALGLGDAAVAAIAKQHLDDYAPVVIAINKAIPAVVLEELAIDGENVQISAAQLAEQNAQDAWK